mmetsp:Transcript_5678/g.14514  ORF Transcript_5678/g.14514 Transcript_5678/m.14514 type:complete len:284 (+) Transcript_5678:125-976(+)
MTSLQAVREALGVANDPATAEVAGADNSSDAADVIDLLAESHPSIAKLVTLGERQTTTCNVCKTDASQQSTITHIVADVAAPKQLTLLGALGAMCDSEIHGDESNPIHECQQCGQRNASTRRIHPDAPWPELILVVLRRYSYDFATLSLKKVMHRVAFPSTLDVPVLCRTTHEEAPPKYTLVGAVVHTGPEASSGAYSFERRPEQLKELGLDDTQTPRDSLCPGSATPYVLVYSRAPVGGAVAAAAAGEKSQGNGDVQQRTSGSPPDAGGDSAKSRCCGCELM